MLATATMAVLGHLLGPVGAVIAAAVTVASLIAFVGADYLSLGIRIGVVSVGVVVSAAALVYALPGSSLGFPSVTPRGADFVDFRGRQVTKDDVSSRSLPGALRADATLDRLDLTDARLERAVAPVPPSTSRRWSASASTTPTSAVRSSGELTRERAGSSVPTCVVLTCGASTCATRISLELISGAPTFVAPVCWGRISAERGWRARTRQALRRPRPWPAGRS